jgi:hypothetical protein
VGTSGVFRIGAVWGEGMEDFEILRSGYVRRFKFFSCSRTPRNVSVLVIIMKNE